MRVVKIFTLLLTFFLLIKRKESFLGYKPLPPKKLKERITSLGASFIKLAQVLATRADFFSPSYLEELKSLHDELPPMKKEEFEEVFKRAFPSNPFSYFSSTPIASASIGQVHIAYLGQKKVAVKLRRLGIEKRVKQDIKILQILLFLFRPLFSEYTKNSLEAVIKEFSSMILQEVNLTKELSNLKKFKTTYGHCKVVFPTPYEELCSQDALVMEFMEGVRFDDKDGLKRLGVDFKIVLEKLINFYAEQMLVVGLFHADPHPGNLLVNSQGELILLDFGMVKRIANETRIALIELIKAAHERDYDLYVSAAKRLGTVTYEAPKALVAEFVEEMFSIFSDESLSAVNMQKLAFEVLESMRELPFKLPQEAIYILRVSVIIEGLGTTYISNFNGIKDILPILQKNIPRALGYKSSLVEMMVDEVKTTPYFFHDLKTTVRKTTQGELEVQISPMQLEWLKKEIKEYIRPFILAFTFLLGGIFLAVMGERGVAVVVFGIGVIQIIFFS